MGTYLQSCQTAPFSASILTAQHSFPPSAHWYSGVQFGLDLSLVLLSSVSLILALLSCPCWILMSRKKSQFVTECPQQACCHAFLSYITTQMLLLSCHKGGTVRCPYSEEPQLSFLHDGGAFLSHGAVKILKGLGRSYAEAWAWALIVWSCGCDNWVQRLEANA